MQEEWLDVVGYESVYQVSNLGNVKRIKRPDSVVGSDMFTKVLDLRAEGLTLTAIATAVGLAVSSVHRICSNPDRPAWMPHLIEPQVDRTGYLFVGLSLNGSVKLHRVHTLVVTAFIGVVPRGTCVNHIDGIKTNNKLDNLEISTYKENSVHARDVLGWKSPGPRGELARTAKLTAADVLHIREVNPKRKELVAMANHYGVHYSSIHAILKRKTWTHI